MIISIAVFVCILGIVPILIGSLYIDDKDRATNSSIIRSYAQGIFMMWGIFQIIVIPLLLMKESLTLLTVLWSIVIIGLCLLAAIKGRGKITSLFKIKPSFKAYISWPIIIAFLLIAFQTYMLTTRMVANADDAFYVAAATTAIETDTIFSVSPYTGELFKAIQTRYALSPFFVFTAMISEICGIHTTIIAHTLFPLILIPLAYMVYAMLGGYFFKGNTKAVGIFLIAISLAQMFSAFSVYTTGVFTLTRIWQGKAILAGILIPAILYFAVVAFEQIGNKKNWINLLMIMFASCMVSSMGMALSVITLGILVLIWSIREKNLRVVSYSLLCCVPNIIYSAIYLIIKNNLI